MTQTNLKTYDGFTRDNRDIAEQWVQSGWTTSTDEGKPAKSAINGKTNTIMPMGSKP